jgi:cytochrome b pre-mRNA-processing protein 6
VQLQSSFPVAYTNHLCQTAQRHILRALSQWPKDTIRPTNQFQDVLRKRFEQPSTTNALSEQEQLKQANALYSLLDDRYKKQVRRYSH